jgi:hypothetical protein
VGRFGGDEFIVLMKHTSTKSIVRRKALELLTDLEYVASGGNISVTITGSVGISMYDGEGKIIEWYFDITKANGVDEDGKPYYDDLFLDLVLLPDGQVITLDEDELLEALNNGIITREDYDLAYRVKDRLLDRRIVSLDYVIPLCDRLLALF